MPVFIPVKYLINIWLHQALKKRKKSLLLRSSDLFAVRSASGGGGRTGGSLCCVDADCLPGPSKGRSSVPPVLPRLAGVLPPLQLCVWKGQRGQHGDGKEGRLCRARPPGRPEGKGAWRALEQRKRVSGKKETFSLLLLFSLCVVFMCRASGLLVELCD